MHKHSRAAQATFDVRTSGPHILRMQSRKSHPGDSSTAGVRSISSVPVASVPVLMHPHACGCSAWGTLGRGDGSFGGSGWPAAAATLGDERTYTREASSNVAGPLEGAGSDDNVGTSASASMPSAHRFSAHSVPDVFTGAAVGRPGWHTVSQMRLLHVRPHRWLPAQTVSKQLPHLVTESCLRRRYHGIGADVRSHIRTPTACCTCPQATACGPPVATA